MEDDNVVLQGRHDMWYSSQPGHSTDSLTNLIMDINVRKEAAEDRATDVMFLNSVFRGPSDTSSKGYKDHTLDIIDGTLYLTNHRSNIRLEIADNVSFASWGEK